MRHPGSSSEASRQAARGSRIVNHVLLPVDPAAKDTAISFIMFIDTASPSQSAQARSEIGPRTESSSDWESAHPVVIEFLDTTGTETSIHQVI